MSIIGTRPPLISETNLYELHHRARLAIKPGITGMWQVSGRSDITDFEEVVRLDKEYITNWNIGLDIKILFNSNLTYRMYDYDRTRKDGKKRELHIDKALKVANLKSSTEPRQPLRVLRYRQGVALELLTRCKYFEVYRMLINTERRQKVHYRADEIAFRVLLCVNGCGTISYEDGSMEFYKGDCIFVPADSEVLTISGQAQFLDVRG